MSMPQHDNAAMVLDKLPSLKFAAEYERMHPGLEELQTQDLKRFSQMDVSERGRGSSRVAKTGRSSRNAPPPQQQPEEAEANPHDPLLTDNVSLYINVSMPYMIETNSMSCLLTKRHMSDILAHAKLESKDIEKCVIHRVVINSIAGLTDSRWSMTIRDGAPIPRNVKTLPGMSHSYVKDSQFSITGYPVSNHNNANGQTIVYDSDGVVDADIERYGRFNLDLLTQGVLEWPDRDNQKHMLIPAYPNGMYFFYALVTRSSSPLKNMGMKMKLFDDERYICMPLGEYNLVVGAYKEKLRKIEEKMHNLSTLEITMRPLTDGIRVSEHEEAFVSLRIDCAMPNLK